ncbi:MAG: hypothetical protein AB7S61_02745 [Methanoregulaceae archaeon]
MAPRILLVPVVPQPPRPLLEVTAERLSAVFLCEVDLVEPLVPPSVARLDGGVLDPGPVRVAMGAYWGCGCRTRLVGVTGARLRDGPATGGEMCTTPLLVRLGPGETGAVVRAVGQALGLGACEDPGCALHPRVEPRLLCPVCRSHL